MRVCAAAARRDKDHRDKPGDDGATAVFAARRQPACAGERQVFGVADGPGGGLPVFTREAVDGLAREGAHRRRRRHLRLGQRRVEQAEAVQYGIVELRLDVGQPAEEMRKMLGARHLAAPALETRLGLPADAFVAHEPPERRVLALGDVMQVDEGAEIVDLTSDAGVVVVALLVTRPGGVLEEAAGEHQHLHDGAMDRGGFQRFEEARG